MTEVSVCCLLCHVDNTGGSGTAVRPFALTLQEYGVGTSSDAAQLHEVLAALGDEDSDDDGVSDVDELLAGADPNTPGGGEPTEILVYEYGCDLAPSQRSGSRWGVLLIASLVLAAGRRRRSE